MKKPLIAIGIIAALGAVALAYYMYSKPVESLSASQPVAEFESTVLFEEFEADEAGANKKYVGKVLAVSGPVVETMVNSDSSTTVILGTSHPVFGIKCRLDPGEEPANLPSKGENLNLKGLCTGMNADVELNQCIILKN